MKKRFGAKELFKPVHRMQLGPALRFKDILLIRLVIYPQKHEIRLSYIIYLYIEFRIAISKIMPITFWKVEPMEN